MRSYLDEPEYGVPRTNARTIGPATKGNPLRDGSAYQITRVAGIAEVSGSLRDLRLSSPQLFPLTNLRDSYGEWIALAQPYSEPRHSLLFADHFGYGTLFYSLVPGVGVVFSETFNGAIAGVRDCGGKLTLDELAYLAALTAEGRFFDGHFMPRTMANEISLLDRGKMLVVDDETVQITNREHLLSAEERDRGYEECLAQGLDHAALVARGTLGVADANVINLSGGIDSRLCLGILQRAGVAKEFSVRSVDPRKWRHTTTQESITRDIEVADALRRQHEMDWFADTAPTRIAVTPQTAVSAKMLYRSNFLFSADASASLPFPQSTVLAIRGGGGDMLRVFTSNQRMHARYLRAVQNEDPPRAVSRWRGQTAARASSAIPELQRFVRTAVIESFKPFDSRGSQTALDDHYFHYRNRYHFGHHRTSSQNGESVLHLLSEPWIHRASTLVDSEYKEQGGVVGDMFRILGADLLDFAFESQEWTEKLNPKSAQAPTNGWENSYDKRQPKDEGPVYAAGMSPAERGLPSAVRVTELATEALSQELDCILQAITDAPRELVEMQHQAVMHRVRNEPRHISRVRGVTVPCQAVLEGGQRAHKALDISSSPTGRLDDQRPALEGWSNLK